MCFNGKIILPLNILLTLVLLASCKKKEEKEPEEKVPVANFTADKAEYTSGDVIRLTNTSSDAETFRWTLPTGETSRERDVTFQTAPSGNTLITQFKLEAFSKSGNKSDFIVRNFTLKQARGKVVIYSGYTGLYTLYIDGLSIGNHLIDWNSFAVPNCEDAGCVTVELPIGAHVVSGYVSSQSTNVTFAVTVGGCEKVRLW